MMLVIIFEQKFSVLPWSDAGGKYLLIGDAVVVITPSLPRDGGTEPIQVHAVNLIETRLGER